MTRALRYLSRLNACLVNWFFIARELVQARFCSARKMKVLFTSKADWEPWIRKGFAFTQHQIKFWDIRQEPAEDYDLVVPLTIDDVKYLSETRDVIRANPITIPSTQCILLCDDKLEFSNALIANGFADNIPKMGNPLAFPYLVKKRVDSFGRNTHVIHDAQEKLQLADLLADPEYFTQDLIPGLREYATHIIYKGNSIVCAINIEYLFKTETPIKGKDPEVYSKICQFPYRELFSAVLASIGFEGLCCVNYKARNGIPMIIEINPRFGGSLCPFFFSFLRHLNIPEPRRGTNRIPETALT